MYVFVPEYNAATEKLRDAGGFYSHLVDGTFSTILARNDSDHEYVLPRHTYVGVAEPTTVLRPFECTQNAHETAVARDVGRSSLSDNEMTHICPRVAYSEPRIKVEQDMSRRGQ
ncbi:hypothetical protein N7489_010141 [Penicillium chrysogenum]|uniref:uncharacterized protein n=1 Tax=Penicillium chrysogenum TaxID=5076 RepID=UPI0024DF1391|nr:uncharacterized protein N7489_010141 [Penicillium chrysogenum]KAJ5229433.1 hypothetical protein N7489_010141 [Penicillium chrysogenum]